MPWDPLSDNPYRLLGVPREQQPPQRLSAAVVLAIPGLAQRKLTQNLLDDCLLRLHSDQLPFWQACWFDSTRPLDQLAWLDVCEGRLQQAWRRWTSESHWLSRHNLAVLAHLRWLNQPDQLKFWLDCAQRWRELAEQTQDLGYRQVLEGFLRWQDQRAFELVAQGQWEPLRQCWQVSAALSSWSQVDQQQRHLLKVEMERWDLGISELRKSLLEGAELEPLIRDFESRLLPQSEFLLQSTQDNRQLAQQLSKDLALFYRLLARCCWDRQELDQAESWLERALPLAPEEFRGEWRAELEHWRLSRYPRQARPVQGEFLRTRQELESPRRRILIGLLVAGLTSMALIWAALHPPDPLDRLTRPAAQKRADEIVSELSPLAHRLAQLGQEIDKAQGPARGKLEEERERLRQRHAALKGELVKLQKWLDRH